MNNIADLFNEAYDDEFEITTELRAKVYNALANIGEEFHEQGIMLSPNQFQLAFEWFDTHFWDSNDD